MKRYICNQCIDFEPCFLEVKNDIQLPTICPYNHANKSGGVKYVKWQELPESDYFEMRGFCKVKSAAETTTADDTKKEQEQGKFLACESCRYRDGSNLSVCVLCEDYDNNGRPFYFVRDNKKNCDTCYDMNLFEAKKKQETPNKRGKILLKALDIINGERQDQYGSPEDSFSLIADYWTTFLKSRDLIPSKGSYHALKISPKEVSEMMMLFKIARMSGQKPSLDNYLDLVGYAGIAADMIEEDKK